MGKDDEWVGSLGPDGEDVEPHRDIPPPSPKERDDKERSEPKRTEETIGGFAFFLSFAVLVPSAIFVIRTAVFSWRVEFVANSLLFVLGALVGVILAALFIRNHISVLIHEFKHQLISNLVGNKSKGFKIDRNSGHFEYAYTKATRHFNAFISLAPYIVPLFSLLGLLIAATLFRFRPENRHYTALMLGVGYGTDLLLNLRDISPIQSDINEIRGGYCVGLTYIVIWNAVIVGMLFIVASQGVLGVLAMGAGLSEWFVGMHRLMVGGE